MPYSDGESHLPLYVVGHQHLRRVKYERARPVKIYFTIAVEALARMTDKGNLSDTILDLAPPT